MSKAVASRKTVVNDDGGTQKVRLYRSAIQTAQRLEIQLKSATDWQELFQPETLALRERLKESCQIMMMNHTLEYGRKAEEVLWRRVFYDVIQKLKQQKRGRDGVDGLDSVYRMHLLSASGFYHHLLVHLSSKFSIKLTGVIDWSDLKHSRKGGDAEIDGEAKEWAHKACQRCLIYLGDLARYQQDLEEERSFQLAERFYYQAHALDPDPGMPHNQLGTLLSNQWFGLDAVYHYMRCLLSAIPFDGTEGNLVRLFEKNRCFMKSLSESITNGHSMEFVLRELEAKRFIVNFISLQDVLFGTSSFPPEDVGLLCQSILQDFDTVLSSNAHPHPSSQNPRHNTDSTPAEGEDQEPEHVVSGTIVLKVFTIIIMSITRLKPKGSSWTSVATAFSLALFSQLLQHCINHLEKALGGKLPLLMNKPLQNGTPKADTDPEEVKIQKVKELKKKSFARRRRQQRHYSDSDISEEILSSDSGEESDLSEGGFDVSLEDVLSEDDLDDVYIEEESGEESGSDLNSTTDTLHSPINSSLLCNGYTASSPAEKELSVERSDAVPMVNGTPGKKRSKEHAKSKHNQDNLKEMKTSFEEALEVQLLRAVLKEELLISVKIFCDWLRINSDVISTCEESSSSLWTRMATLLNILPTSDQLCKAVSCYGSSLKTLANDVVDENWSQAKALPEDLALIGLTPLSELHHSLNKKWGTQVSQRKYHEAIIRIQCLRSFGMYVASNKVVGTLSWDASSKTFSMVEEMNGYPETNSVEEKTRNMNHHNQEKQIHLMKTLAQQRLKSEVAELESKMKTSSDSATAYVIPDVHTMCIQLRLVRKMLQAEKYVIIIPLQVIAALDELKKVNQGSRDAIKFLEYHFKQRTKWIRAQKETEKIGVNNKKSRHETIAVWRFNQIVNCCQYFADQFGAGVVTLLTGEEGSNKRYPPHLGNMAAISQIGSKSTPQALRLASQNGIGVESITTFCQPGT